MVGFEQLFLWPFLLPITGLWFYSMRYKPEVSRVIGFIVLSSVLIVLFYMPLLQTDVFGQYTYIFVKYLLFIILPLLLVSFGGRILISEFLKKCGVRREAVLISVRWGVVLLPVMLGVSFILFLLLGLASDCNWLNGCISFFESFSEEFYFRGVLFLLLLPLFRFEVVYVVSVSSFILVHPQNFSSVFLIGTMVQGVLTVEIVRRSENLLGAWILHGLNRVFVIVVLPFILS